MIDLLYLIIITSIIAVFFCILAGFVLKHALNCKNNQWLFANWQENVYNTLFYKTSMEIVGKKLGIDVKKFLHNCYLCKVQPKLKAIIINRICGFLIIMLSVILGIFTGSLIFLLFGVLIGFPLIMFQVIMINGKAQKRRFQLANELPRYLDLLQTALLIDMPIEQALDITSRNIPETVLAEELQLAMADTQLGSTSWQNALEKLAADYEVDELSDFVLDVVNAYNNGSPILESVQRKSQDAKKTNLLKMKERAGKLTSTILIPVLFFKIIPLLLILCIPVVLQLNSGGFA